MPVTLIASIASGFPDTSTVFIPSSMALVATSRPLPSGKITLQIASSWDLGESR
jgi:hypothetical protein